MGGGGKRLVNDDCHLLTVAVRSETAASAVSFLSFTFSHRGTPQTRKSDSPLHKEMQNKINRITEM